MNRFIISSIALVVCLFAANAAADEVDAGGIMTSNLTGTDECVEFTGGPANGVSCSTAMPGGGDSVCAPLNGGLGCSPTEQLFASYSLDCYNCMVAYGALDDSVYGDTDNECEDVAGTAQHGAQAGQNRASLCAQVIECALAVSLPSADPALLYCGTLGDEGCCTAWSPSTANGPCKTIELAAIEHSSTEAPSSVVPDLYNPNYGGGQANIIFAKAQSGGCTSVCPFLE